MEIQGEQNLTVPRGDVWRALNDPAVLQRCLPGCDTFESDGDNRYRVAMQAAVGPVRARFAGKLQLSDIAPPSSYSLSFEGSGGVAGFGKGTARVTLDDVAGGTRLRYSAQAQVGGRLAQVGARLIDGVTKRMADDFFTRFARELNAQEGGVAPAVLPAPAPISTPVQSPAVPPEAARPASSPQATQIAVIAAAVAATAAAVAVLAALYVVQFAR